MISITERYFYSEKDRKLRNLEWRGISGENNATILSVRGYGEPKIQKHHKNIVTKSGKYFIITS